MSNKYTSWLNDINEQTEKPIEHQLDKNEVISKYEFNFEVDEETENYLKEQAYKIHISANKMYNEFGKIFKETQEKLSLKGYGCFYEWFERLGFKKDSVYRYIGRYNLIVALGDKQKIELVESLPIKLAYEISKDNCSEELKEKVLRGEITTLNQYMEARKKIAEEQIELTTPIIEILDINQIFEMDFNSLDKNYKNFSKLIKDKFDSIPKDKKEKFTKKIENLNKEIEKLINIL